MKLTTFTTAVGLLTATVFAGTSETRPRRIAIIGAGAAGASTAYHIRQFADEDGVAVNISLFEKTDHIGGRTVTVHAYDDPNQPVELGASIFVEVNAILWGAAHNFNLPLIPAGGNDDDGGLLGIWDGDRFVYTQDDRSYGWWNLVKLFWKYGTAPYRANKLMQATIGRFLSLYEKPYFPFRSLTTRAYELELTYVTSQTGAQYLKQNKVGEAFAHDIVQASTRVNYASNLARLHGLDTMVALAPAGASQIRGGNWQIFDRMARASRAAVHLNTSVQAIDKVDGTQPPDTKYTLKTTDNADIASSSEYDNIVVATPFQFSSISTGDGVLQTAIDEIPYVQLHVTLFASPLRLSAAYFGLEPGTAVPTTVLTTLAKDDDEQGSSGADGAGKAGFFSVSTLRRAINPDTLREEYLYKIFSPEKVTPEFLGKLFDVDVPDTFVDHSESKSGVPVISWYHPHVFFSYPKAFPRVTFQDPVVGDGLYYTSGIEGFISTMETSALMGKNVARLIVDDIQGLATGEAVPEEEKKGEAEKTEKDGKIAGLRPDDAQQFAGEL